MAEREGLLESLLAMTRQHFAMARHVWSSREPDFLMMVEIGPDRLHHAFFADMDPRHPRHVPDGPFAGAGESYYRALDAELQSLVALADADTAILVASDHGARPLRSAFCINEWLLRRGYLRLRELPAAPLPLRPDLVDWTQTRAWAEGGYYARVFLNVRGREPHGCVHPSDAAGLRGQLRAELSALGGENGEVWSNRIQTPEEAYREALGGAPDLLCVFDDLNVRALSTVGSGALYAEGDDRGADACNHDWHGIFVLAGAGVQARGELRECAIQDVGVTALRLLGVEKPSAWLGQDRSAQA
jgi:predicted AlkP superfamily phosphohydrolase/phosphomutase